MVFQTPQDIVNSFHEMTTSILHTIKLAKDTNRLSLRFIFDLEKKSILYNDKYLSFSEYITALKEDTHFVKGYFYNTPSTLSADKLKPQLTILLNSIKSIIPKISREYNSVLDFIKGERKFDISPSHVINIFHVLINIARDHRMFDTIELIDGIWPDLRQKIITKNIKVANYLNAPPPPNIKRMNQNTRRVNQPQKPNTPGTYPFGATRKRRRV